MTLWMGSKWSWGYGDCNGVGFKLIEGDGNGLWLNPDDIHSVDVVVIIYYLPWSLNIIDLVTINITINITINSTINSTIYVFLCVFIFYFISTVFFVFISGFIWCYFIFFQLFFFLYLYLVIFGLFYFVSTGFFLYLYLVWFGFISFGFNCFFFVTFFFFVTIFFCNLSVFIFCFSQYLYIYY